MGVGAAVVNADWVALASLWEVPTTPIPAEMVAQMLKRVGKWMWRPESVVCVVDCGGVAAGTTAGVASTGGLKMLFPHQSH
jgi:hypothetical protein